MGFSFHRGHSGEPGRGLVYRGLNFKEEWRGVLRIGHLSPRALYEGKLEGGGSFTGDPGGCVKKGSGDRHLSPYGPLWGPWKGFRISGNLKYERRRTHQWRRALGMGLFSLRELHNRNLEGELLYWEPRRICWVRLWKWEYISIEAGLLGHVEGRSFSRAFERRWKCIYWGKFLWVIWQIFKKSLQTGNSLIRGPVGEPEEGSFTGTFERKWECISVFLLLGPSAKSAGHLELSRTQGSPELI
jgi:hypothetical protein